MRRPSTAAVRAGLIAAGLGSATAAVAEPAVTFSFDKPLVHVAAGEPISLQATITVDPASPDPFVTGAGAVLYIGGFPELVLGLNVPSVLWPAYTLDESAFVNSISNLHLTAGESAHFTYGTFVPQSPLGAGTYSFPEIAAWGDGWIEASTYCTFLYCNIIAGPFAGPTNTETIVVSAPEPLSWSLFAIASAATALVFSAGRARPLDRSRHLPRRLRIPSPIR
jgi:hypothetical protein